MFKWVKKAARGSVGWAGNVFGYRMVVGGAHYIGDLCKALLLPGQRLPDETFEEALHRLNLTQEDVEKKRTDFLLQALLYFVCFLCVSGYVFYLFEQGAWYASSVSIGIGLIFLLRAYRAHFWAFQIKHRKLGCTFAQWFKGRIDDEEASL